MAATLSPEHAPRLGITASRKVGNAVARNRVKRAVREWFRTERRSLSADRDYVVILRAKACELSAGDLARELSVALAIREECG